MVVEIRNNKFKNYTRKLEDYINLIELETKRKIVLELDPESGSNRNTVSLQLFPPDGLIIILYSKEGTYEERTIAHEATHGYLYFRKGYCRINVAPNSLINEEILSLLNSMILDIVTDKILQDKGFKPFSSTYFPYLKEKIEDLKQNIDFYAYGIKDVDLKNKIYTVNYLLNWGYQKYYNLTTDQRIILKEFNKLLQERQVKEVDISLKIINLIKNNDIFTRDGYKKVLQQISKIWGIENQIIVL